MSYMNYRRRIEFGTDECDEIDRYCRDRQLIWFASPWDGPSVDFLEGYDPPCYKIPSAALTDDNLIRRMRAHRQAADPLHGHVDDGADPDGGRGGGAEEPADHPLHQHISLPSEELNLRMILTLRDEFGCPVGYSGHEVGLQTTYAAIVLGACLIERHATLDRAMWGSDQAASVEPSGLARLVRDIRIIEQALGDGQKRRLRQRAAGHAETTAELRS